MAFMLHLLVFKDSRFQTLLDLLGWTFKFSLKALQLGLQKPESYKKTDTEASY